MGSWCVYASLFADYMRNMPRIPHAELGRIYSYSIQGFYVYLTQEQYFLIDGAPLVTLPSNVTATLLVTFIANPPVEAEESRRTDYCSRHTR